MKTTSFEGNAMSLVVFKNDAGAEEFHIHALQQLWGCDSLHQVALRIARLAEPGAGLPILVYPHGQETVTLKRLDTKNKLKTLEL